MSIRNHNWYDLNAQRAYPLDDTASCVDDSGSPLPPDILVDAAIRMPRALGGVAFLSAVTASPGIVTVAFQAAPEAGSPAGFVPIGAVTVARPVVVGRHYPLEPLADGVGGWVVFGDGIDEPYVGRFSTPAQGLLAPRTARPYGPLPVESLGKAFVEETLSGTILIKAGNDISVSKEPRTIAGRDVDALVLRLADDLGRNVFDLYGGPCKGRPESGNCRGASVKRINTVEPDCAGNITLRFRRLRAYEGENAAVLELPVGLGESCEAGRLPSGGALPGEYDDGCPHSSSSESSSDNGLEPEPCVIEPVGMTTYGIWVPVEGNGYPDSGGVRRYLEAPPESVYPYGAYTAWNFAVVPGRTYRFWITWPDAEPSSIAADFGVSTRATDAPLEVTQSFGSGYSHIADVVLDQSAEPGPRLRRGYSWTQVGVYTAAADNVVFFLGTSADGIVYADAMFAEDLDCLEDHSSSSDGGGGSDSSSSEDAGCEGTPYCTSFDDLTGWTFPTGAHTVTEESTSDQECSEAGDPAALALTNTAARNVAVYSLWNNCEDDVSVAKIVSTMVRFSSDHPSPEILGGVVVNHRLVGGQYRYFLVGLNPLNQTLEAWSYNGGIAGKLGEVELPSGFQLSIDAWYKIAVRTRWSLNPGQVDLICTYTNPSDPGQLPVVLTVTTASYGSPDGKFGVGTTRSWAEFAYLKIVEA